MTMRLTADRRAARRDRAARDAPPLQLSAMDEADGLRSDEIAARRDQLQGPNPNPNPNPRPRPKQGRRRSAERVEEEGAFEGGLLHGQGRRSDALGGAWRGVFVRGVLQVSTLVSKSSA